MPDTRDVVIVGAGPAGSALAYFLASQGLDVLLLDKAAFPRDKTCGDGLSPRALRVLRTMGVLDKVAGAGLRVNGVHIYAPNGRRVSVPVPPWGDLPQYSLILPRYQLDDLLRAHAVAAGADFRARVDVVDLLHGSGGHGAVAGVEAKTPDGLVAFRARYTVLATGASVALLERARLLDWAPQYSRAARTYYEGVGDLTDYMEFHLESVPLPGYGWVFPISPTAANVGAGYFVQPSRPDPRHSPRRVFDGFVSNPIIAPRLRAAHAPGSVRSYPLRTDFPVARVAYPGVLLVGEAAGLVHPLTGEGIDYALESAEAGAGVLAEAVRHGAPADQAAHDYARVLRDSFLRAFVIITHVRDLYFRPWLLNRTVSAAIRHEGFRNELIHICLGNVSPARGLSPDMLFQIARG